MTFEVHKVVDEFYEKWIGKKVYYADDLLNLMMYVEGKKEEEPAKVCKKGSPSHPFWIEDDMGNADIWKYIYPAEDIEMPKEEKYRPFESVDELVDVFKMHVCNNPKMPPNAMPLIWLKYKNSNSVCMVTGFTDNGIEMGAEFQSWGFLIERMTFFNGYPCGVKVC